MKVRIVRADERRQHHRGKRADATVQSLVTHLPGAGITTAHARSAGADVGQRAELTIITRRTVVEGEATA